MSCNMSGSSSATRMRGRSALLMGESRTTVGGGAEGRNFGAVTIRCQGSSKTGLLSPVRNIGVTSAPCRGAKFRHVYVPVSVFTFGHAGGARFNAAGGGAAHDQRRRRDLPLPHLFEV